jgi:hypothetical protein
MISDIVPEYTSSNNRYNGKNEKMENDEESRKESVPEVSSPD